MSLRNKYLYHNEDTFFITTTCNHWFNLLDIGSGYKIVIDSLNFCCKKYQCQILGYVLMPNHVHLIIHFEKGENRMGFMRDFKKFTSTMIRKEIELHQPGLLNRLRGDRQLFKIWQERFDELYLVSKNVLESKLSYIHTNPLQEKWGFVKYPEEYPYSSAQFYETGNQNMIRVHHYQDYF